MIISDQLAIFLWWFFISGIGVLAFPITSHLFSRFWDKGWAFSRIIGVGLLSYFAWIVGSLHLVSFSLTLLWIGIGILAYGGYLIWPNVKKQILNFIKYNRKLILIEETIFFLALVFWSWVRTHQPDINGLEKFMDFGFVNSILRSQYFPPLDMWLQGYTINYYYFGHLVTAVLSKLTNLPPAFTYNLSIALIFAFSFLLTFSLSGALLQYLLKKQVFSKKQLFSLSIVGGLISASVLSLGGNLHTIITVISKGAQSYWYPDATRYIPYTIHEFPLYSFVVADLHGHFNNIPFVLLMIGLILSFVVEISQASKFRLSSRPVLTRLTIMGLLVAILFMTNAMDAPIYLIVTGVALFASISKRFGLINAALNSALTVGVIGLAALMFSLPFHLAFKPFTEGVKFVDARSPIYQLLVLWGFFLFVGLIYVVLSLLNKYKGRFLKVFLNQIALRFVLSLSLVSLLLVIIPEIVYIKDIYIADYHRANTMFKLVYQTFIMMSVVTGPAFIGLILSAKIITEKKIKFGLVILSLLFVMGLASVLYYPYFAIRSYYGELKQRKSLDGIAWLKREDPDDYAAVLWLNRNIDGQPVILEAVGESYTTFARVSANTGLPTVLGWRVHEWLWRGSFDIPGARTVDVETLYTSTNISEVCRLAETFNVDYVFVGYKEREQYQALTKEVFEKIGVAVFSQGETTVYIIKRPCSLVSL